VDTAEPPQLSAPAPVDRVAPPWSSAESQSQQPPRALEFGIAGLLLSGGGVGSYLGASPFLVAELSHGVLLRPSIGFGQSLAPQIRSSWGAARFDTCLRIEGNYSAGSGMQLDLCGGLDAGLSYVASGTRPGEPTTGQTLPFVSIGPSVDLRSELGSAAVTLRVAVGADVAARGYTDVTGERLAIPPFPVRLEIGFSWDAHSTPSQPSQIARAGE
jgi:hypothetical protein